MTIEELEEIVHKASMRKIKKRCGQTDFATASSTGK